MVLDHIEAAIVEAFWVTAAACAVRDGTRSVSDLDRLLRSAGGRLNPGTTADLVAATLLAAQLTGVRLP